MIHDSDNAPDNRVWLTAVIANSSADLGPPVFHWIAIWSGDPYEPRTSTLKGSHKSEKNPLQVVTNDDTSVIQNMLIIDFGCFFFIPFIIVV